MASPLFGEMSAADHPHQTSVVLKNTFFEVAPAWEGAARRRRHSLPPALHREAVGAGGQFAAGQLQRLDALVWAKGPPEFSSCASPSTAAPTELAALSPQASFPHAAAVVASMRRAAACCDAPPAACSPQAWRPPPMNMALSGGLQEQRPHERTHERPHERPQEQPLWEQPPQGPTTPVAAASAISVQGPSIGSGGHFAGTCRPCVFVKSELGCKYGTSCRFCHILHAKSPKMRPCKGKRERFRKTMAFIEERVANDPDILATGGLVLPAMAHRDPNIFARTMSHLAQVAADSYRARGVA